MALIAHEVFFLKLNKNHNLNCRFIVVQISFATVLFQYSYEVLCNTNTTIIQNLAPKYLAYFDIIRQGISSGFATVIAN